MPRMPTTVLFADPDHGPRAQMAAAVLRRVDVAGRYEVSSAGSRPGGDLSGVAEVLAERGVGFVPESQQLDLSMAP
jgi:protein-tyrosine-phosphatase